LKGQADNQKESKGEALSLNPSTDFLTAKNSDLRPSLKTPIGGRGRSKHKHGSRVARAVAIF
jgi:hypothetical protein